MKNMDKNWRVSMVLTKEQENAILSMRQQDEFRRCSISELVRRVIDTGLQSYGYFQKESSADTATEQPA